MMYLLFLLLGACAAGFFMLFLLEGIGPRVGR